MSFTSKSKDFNNNISNNHSNDQNSKQLELDKSPTKPLPMPTNTNITSQLPVKKPRLSRLTITNDVVTEKVKFDDGAENNIKPQAPAEVKAPTNVKFGKLNADAMASSKLPLKKKCRRALELGLTCEETINDNDEHISALTLVTFRPSATKKKHEKISMKLSSQPESPKNQQTTEPNHKHLQKLNIFGKFKTIPTSSELLVFIGFNEIQERWEFIGGKQKKRKNNQHKY